MTFGGGPRSGAGPAFGAAAGGLGIPSILGAFGAGVTSGAVETVVLQNGRPSLKQLLTGASFGVLGAGVASVSAARLSIDAAHEAAIAAAASYTGAGAANGYMPQLGGCGCGS